LNIIFSDRKEAGIFLAGNLVKYSEKPDTIILALPRGGVPVAYEVSIALKLPLNIFIVRKLGTPWNPELAMGAVAEGGLTVLNEDIINGLEISEASILKITERETQEIERRAIQYRKGAPAPVIRDKTVILIDDGLATGATMKAAVKALKKMEALRVVVAVPVAPPSTCSELEKIADEVVCYSKPEHFSAVGEWYEDFTQTTDEEVEDLLKRRE
jgi:predicted phosphoribosyltransferase